MAPRSEFKPTKHDRLPASVRQTILSEDDLSDPVGRQYVRDARESRILPEESSDPIGDEAHSPVKGIVHRYPDRVLLKITDTCAVYCRFCFRKDMVGQGHGMLSEEELNNAISYIEGHDDVREVILTGGDPLTLSNRRLDSLMARLEAIPHIDIIRFHTRAPIATPERIDTELTDRFLASPKAVYLVLHVNHAQEISAAVEGALFKLSRSGAVLLSQSVLLKNVNDNPETLEALFRKLLAHRVKPYYLHHPDYAPGTSHFRLSIKEGQDIVRQLRGRVTGLAYPTYVLDIPGGYGKMPLTPVYLEECPDHRYVIEDYQGVKHLYPPREQTR